MLTGQDNFIEVHAASIEGFHLGKLFFQFASMEYAAVFRQHLSDTFSPNPANLGEGIKDGKRELFLAVNSL